MRRKWAWRWLAVLPLLTTMAGAQDVRHRFVRVDNGNNQLVHVDQRRPEHTWFVRIPAGARSIQILPDNGQGIRILINHAEGAGEYDLRTGRALPWRLSKYKGVTCAWRLPAGNTLLGLNGGQLVEVGLDGKETRRIVLRVRIDWQLVTLLEDGRFVVGGAGPREVWVVSQDGAIQQRFPVTEKGYKAVRLADGHFLVSAGDAARVEERDAAGKLVRWFGGKKEHPGLGLDFCSGWDRLGNGNIVMCNWLGHRKPDAGWQLLEFTPENKLV